MKPIAKVFAALVLLSWPLKGFAAEPPGKAIYMNQCAACHGERGEGVEGAYGLALVGDRSVASLTKYIHAEMPEGDTEAVVGDDAQAVAAYIHEAFYSPLAQARNNPPRIELSRLTVRQYRNSVADLFGSFVPPAKIEPGNGLHGEYFNSGRRINERSRKLERVDSQVKFTFKKDSPPPKVNAEEYAIRWSGGLFAPKTGEYQIILKPQNGARLWLNDEREALVDAWVQSGYESEYRETVFLLGGRYYPLRVETFKGKKEDTLGIELRWKPPEHVEEVIPSRLLSPGKFPEVVVVDTAFPPDDRSMGYERGNSVSKAWDEATTYAALDLTARVAKNLRDIAGVPVHQPEARDRLRDFCHKFAERAFRRPLTPEEKTFYVDQHFQGDSDLELATKKAVLLTLKSPRFLYVETGTAEPDAFEIASRISFGLWDSIPDQPLWDAAASGRLQTRDDIRREVRRMLPDPRTKAKLKAFFHQWLELDSLHELSKSAEVFPQFDEHVVSDLRTSLDLFLEGWIEKKDANFRELMLADSIYLNQRLAKFYGSEPPQGTGFQPVAGLPQAGILTHPLLMAGFSYDTVSSPIHRGVFVARSLLGRRLKPPQDAVTPLPPDLHPDLTTRERITLQTKPNACNRCHSMINPLGFPLEHFDAVGRFREQEKGQPVDSSGMYETLAGKTVQFQGPEELKRFLADSPEAQSAFIERLFQHLTKQPILAYGLDRPKELHQFFVKHNLQLRELLVELITVSALPSEKNG